MSAAEEFRKRAEYCAKQANENGRSQPVRATLLQMAAKWHELADDAERVKELMNEPLDRPSDRPIPPTKNQKS
jgi:hypothetical protein